jgi:hypothetical protein
MINNHQYFEPELKPHPPIIVPKIKTAIGLLIMGLICATLVSLMIMIFVPTSNLTKTTQLLLLIAELFLPVPIFFWAWRRHTNLGELLRIKRVSSPSIIASMIVSVSLTVIIDELDRLIQIVLPLPESFASIGEIMLITDWQSALLIIGVVVFAAPLVEEMMFRGFFQRILEYRQGDITKSVLLSAMVFALVHFNPWWVVQIYLMGLFLGYLAWRANSIWPSFVLHAVNNGWSVWWSHQPAFAKFYEWHGHVHPVLIIASLVCFYLGMRFFIKVTPVVEKRQDIVLIENLSDYYENEPPD